MTQRFSASRKRAFLTYLAQSGNQTLAAERAKVSRSWVQLHRSSDAAFDAACREAIAEAVERFESAPSPRPSPARGRGSKGWGFLDGAELVVAGSNRRHRQVRRARVTQWTARVEARFLEALAATCNVKAACAEVGMWPGSAYSHRKRWPAFADAWDAAIETGYAKLEAALIEAGCNLFSERESRTDGPIAEMTAMQALHLLNLHKHKVHGLGGAPGMSWKEAYEAEEERVRSRLERKMRALRLLDD